MVYQQNLENDFKEQKRFLSELRYRDSIDLYNKNREIEILREKLDKCDQKIIYPSMKYCTDNADMIAYLAEHKFKKNKVDKLINERLRLMEIPQLKFDFSYVKVTALVNRFTEKTLETFVNIKNLPDSLIIKLFPQSVQTTFIFLIDNIEEIKSSDFLFYCDFNDTKNGISNSLIIKLDNHPQGVRNIRWSPSKLDYLIRQ